MPRTFQFQVSGKRLLGGLLLTFVPIALLALYSSTRVGAESEQTSGERLEAVSSLVASRVQDLVWAKVVESSLMASDSAVLGAVRTSNQRYGETSDEDIEKLLVEQDSRWNTPRGQQMAEQMLGSPASQALRRKLGLDPDFLRITVTDRHGATVAATHKTLDYYQADEQYWQNIFAAGRGAVSLTDVLYDDATQRQYIGVGVPVFDENNILVGTLDSLVDIASLLPLLNQVELHSEGRIALVKADGTIIASSDGTSLSDRALSGDFSAIQDEAARFQGLASGHIKAAFPDGRERLVAFGDTGLSRASLDFGWKIVASQDASEVLGPSSVTQALIMLIALLTLASIIFAAVYFTMHRQTEIEEMEEIRHSAEAA